MSATGNISGPQFGSVADGTYDVAAHQRWHDEYFRPTRRRQAQELAGRARQSVAEARSARQRGDRPATARALQQAARDREVYAAWSPHLNR